MPRRSRSIAILALFVLTLVAPSAPAQDPPESRDLLLGGPGVDTCRSGPGRDRLKSCERGS